MDDSTDVKDQQSLATPPASQASTLLPVNRAADPVGGESEGDDDGAPLPRFAMLKTVPTDAFPPVVDGGDTSVMSGESRRSSGSRDGRPPRHVALGAPQPASSAPQRTASPASSGGASGD